MKAAASLLAALSAAGCAGGSPSRLYHFGSVPAATAAARAPLRLGVGPIEVAAHLEGDRIAARVTPVELEYYAGHRWAAPLERILEEAIVQGLRESGAFAGVFRTEEADRSPDLVLSGTARRFEEEDRADGWWGVVAIDLSLRDLRAERILWSGEVRAQRRAAARHPSRVVEALREALGEAVGSVPWAEALGPAGPASSAPSAAQ